MTILLLANICYPILAFTGTLMTANRIRAAYIIFLIVEVLMIYIGLETKQIGIWSMAIVYCFTHVYAFRKWGKIEQQRLQENIA